MNKELIARTGRVQSWMDDPTSRLPVSCTVFVMEDSYEGPNGIDAARLNLRSPGSKLPQKLHVAAIAGAVKLPRGAASGAAGWRQEIKQNENPPLRGGGY